jgi:plastocyanin
MINNASKFIAGLAVAGVAGVLAHGLFIADDDRAQLLLFVGLLLAGTAVAIGVGRAVGADLPPFVAKDSASAATSIDPTDVPRPSYGPIILAVAATSLVCGGALGPGYVVAALVIGAVGAGIWLFDSFRTGVIDPRDATNVDNRLLGPIAMPVGAAILTITIAYSFSRVLLAVDETASWVIALIVAAILLAILTAIATKVPTTRVVSILAGVGLLGTLVAGGAGAEVGERDFPHHDEGVPVVEITAANVAFDRNVIGLPADTDAEMIFTNLDVGTFHNVALYTTEEPGSPLFNGVPTARGVVTYRFRTPEAGTYRYICDFHPAMAGELRITADSGTATEAEDEH